MYHSINIGQGNSWINTWTDWHLIPTSRPFVSVPAIRKKSVEIPGRDGEIDLSEFLLNSPFYSNRTGSWEFYISNEYFLYSDPKFVRNAHNWRNWPYAVQTIANFCNGKQCMVWLEDNPDYMYEGRLTVSYSPKKDYSIITIAYDFDPHEIHMSSNNPDPSGPVEVTAEQILSGYYAWIGGAKVMGTMQIATVAETAQYLGI